MLSLVEHLVWFFTSKLAKCQREGLSTRHTVGQFHLIAFHWHQSILFFSKRHKPSKAKSTSTRWRGGLTLKFLKMKHKNRKAYELKSAIKSIETQLRYSFISNSFQQSAKDKDSQIAQLKVVLYYISFHFTGCIF